MERTSKLRKLPYLAAAMGAGGLALRWCLYAFAVDEKDLIVSGHPLSAALWVLTLAAVALILAAVWRLEGSNRYGDNFGPSTEAAAGAFVLAAGVLITVWQTGFSGGMALLRSALGILTAVCLVLTGISRHKGRRPLFLFHLVVCVYFGVQNVSHYRGWSSNPQVQDYVFSLLGGLALTLFAFYQASFDVGSGRRRMQLGAGLLAVVFCLTAAASCEEPALYLTGAVWAFTNLCELEPVPRRKRGLAEPPKE